jgi:uncharacterized membrane protein
MWAVVAGLVVLAVGTILVLTGIFFSFAEYQNDKELDGPEGFVKALTGLVKALSGEPRSTVCFTFGTLLIFLGGVIAGVAGLTS